MPAGPIAGLAADLAHRLLPRAIPAGLRAALTGAVLGAATFLLTLASLALLYTVPLPLGPGSFAGLAYFGAPWLIVNSALGAYAAQAMASGAGRLHTP